MSRDDIASSDLKRFSAAQQHDWLVRPRPRRPSPSGPSASPGRNIRRAAPTLVRQPALAPGRTVAPFGRHLSFGDDPTSQMTVTWQVGVQVSHPFVRYGTNPSHLDRVVEADITSVALPAADVRSVDNEPLVQPTAVTQFYVRAELDDLEPGTTYHYAVGHAGLEPGAGKVARVHSFATAPRRRAPFRFTAFGDQGVSSSAAATARVVEGQSPAFHLHAGDVSYAEKGGLGLLTDSFDPRVFDSFFTEIESAAASTPWMVAVGNHEIEPWYGAHGYGGQLARFAFPGDKPASCIVSSSFSYGNLGVVLLDANDVSHEIQANRGYTDGEQTRWLERALGAFRADASIDFVVAALHQCAYCSCPVHASDGGVQAQWGPIFDRYTVDLVVQGHNHVYERTDPIVGGAPTRQAPIGATVRPASDGTTYITAGSSGRGLYRFGDGVPDSYAGDVNDIGEVPTHVWQPGADGDRVADPVVVEWSRSRYTGYAVLVVEVRPAAHEGGAALMSVQALSADGTLVDEVTLARDR
jgi:hypothetical protein